jgi:hypothetical protein
MQEGRYGAAERLKRGGSRWKLMGWSGLVSIWVDDGASRAVNGNTLNVIGNLLNAGGNTLKVGGN